MATGGMEILVVEEPLLVVLLQLSQSQIIVETGAIGLQEVLEEVVMVIVVEEEVVEEVAMVIVVEEEVVEEEVVGTVEKEVVEEVEMVEEVQQAAVDLPD